MHAPDTPAKPKWKPPPTPQEQTRGDHYTIAHRDVDAISRVADELAAARDKFPPFNSAHEGYAVLLEEVHELWALVMTNAAKRTRGQLQQEATQVAAMAIRFLVDVADQANPTTDALCHTIGEVDHVADDDFETRVDEYAKRIMAWEGIGPKEARERAADSLRRRQAREKLKAARAADLETAFWALVAEWPGGTNNLRNWAQELADDGEAEDQPVAPAVLRILDAAGRVTLSDQR